MSRASCLLLLALAGCGGAPAPATVEPSNEAVPEAPAAPATPAVASSESPGLRVITVPSTSAIVSFRVVFDSGSADDPPGKEGLTQLTARLMLEGAAGELTYAERERALYPMAAELGGSVDREQTAFVGRVHADHLDAFARIFADALVHPRFTDEDFARVRAQTLSELELELRASDDETLGKEVLEAMLYEGHPYGHPELGTVSGLGALTAADARGQHQRVFCGARATLAVAGRFAPELVEQLRSALASLDNASCAPRAALPAVPSRAARVWLVDKPDAQSVAVSMGFPIDVERGDDDYAALVLAVAYLGQHRQFAGRLMQRMRGDRGLNYGDYAYPEHFVQEGWSRAPLPNIARRQQYFSIWLRPLRPEQAHFGVRMAVRELHQFVESGLAEEDFTRIRDYVAQYYALFLTTESRRLGFQVDDAFYGAQAAWLDALRARFATLTVEEVNAAIRRHLDPARLELAIITSDAAQFADNLASDRPSPITYQSEPRAEVLAEDREIIGYPVAIPRARMTVIPVGEVFAR